MHVFFESVWKLHIGEIPEKPELKPHYLGNAYGERRYKCLVQEYNEAIAAIKQNALTVGNADTINVSSLLPSDPKPGEFYKWVGGYETKEIQDIVNWNYPISTITGTSVLTRKTVAILTLPEEKKNTMENMTKTTKAAMTCAQWLSYCLSIGWKKEQLDKLEKIWWEHHDEKGNLTSSGSVAAPKDSEIIEELEAKGARSFINENAALREALKELLSIAEQYRTKIDNPNWEDDFNKSKAIIEKARKLLSK